MQRRDVDGALSDVKDSIPVRGAEVVRRSLPLIQVLYLESLFAGAGAGAGGRSDGPGGC